MCRDQDATSTDLIQNSCPTRSPIARGLPSHPHLDKAPFDCRNPKGCGRRAQILCLRVRGLCADLSNSVHVLTTHELRQRTMCGAHCGAAIISTTALELVCGIVSTKGFGQQKHCRLGALQESKVKALPFQLSAPMSVRAQVSS